MGRGHKGDRVKNNNPYFRIYVDRDDKICIVEMQEFDECDYTQDRFLSAKKFESEDGAINYIRSIQKEKLPQNIIRMIDDFLGTSYKNVLDVDSKISVEEYKEFVYIRNGNTPRKFDEEEDDYDYEDEDD